MQILANALRTRLARGTLVNVYALAVQLAVQVLAVPLLARAWGEAVLGQWLMLSTIPVIFIFSDLGLGSAASSVMTTLATKGQHDEAGRVYTALRRFTMIAAAGVALLAAGIAYLSMSPAMRASGDWLIALLCLSGYGYMIIFNAVSLAAFQAADRYAQGQIVFHTSILVEGGAAIACALAGGTPGMVAAVYLGVRVVSAIINLAILRRAAPWLGGASWAESRHHLRALMRPAGAALLFPIGNAISIQGAVLALGAVAGAAAVPAFAISRTLCRLGAQFAFLVNRASMPRYTVAHSSGDSERTQDLVALNLAASLLLILPAAAGLILFGPPFVAYWTAGEVTTTRTLIALLTAGMVLNSLWIPIANLMLSINQHERFTIAYAGTALVALPAGIGLRAIGPAEGMALAIAAMELFMVVWVWRSAGRLGMLSRAGLRSSAGRLRRKLVPRPAGEG